MDIKNINESIVFKDNTLTKRVLYATNDILTFVLNLKPGQQLPVHRHENSSLILIVLEGTGQIKINDEVEKLAKGAVVYAKGEDDFSIPEVYENLSVIVNIAPNPTNNIYSKNVGE